VVIFRAAAILDRECPLWVKSVISRAGTDVRYYPQSDRDSDLSIGPGGQLGTAAVQVVASRDGADARLDGSSGL